MITIENMGGYIRVRVPARRERLWSCLPDSWRTRALRPSSAACAGTGEPLVELRAAPEESFFTAATARAETPEDVGPDRVVWEGTAIGPTDLAWLFRELGFPVSIEWKAWEDE